ncbi:MAG: SIR2 family protein [Bacillota bacterium]
MLLTTAKASQELKGLLEKEKLSVFVGSGVSVPQPSGLPTWDGFVSKYIEICEALSKALPADMKFDAVVNDARNYKDHDAIRTISALKCAVRKCEKKAAERNLSLDEFTEKIGNIFKGRQHNILHELIVSTNFKYIITSNYDDLLEAAVEHLNISSLRLRSFSYNEPEKISASIYSELPMIIHAHGKAGKVSLGEMVITSDDYLGIMKYNHGFRMTIDSIFMQNSILFVGYGGSDPHFEDIISDAVYSLRWSENNAGLPRYYIVLRKDKSGPVIEEIKNSKRTSIIAIDDYNELEPFLRGLKDCYPRL